LSLLAPCGAGGVPSAAAALGAPGASAPSVRRRNYATDHSARIIAVGQKVSRTKRARGSVQDERSRLFDRTWICTAASLRR